MRGTEARAALITAPCGAEVVGTTVSMTGVMVGAGIVCVGTTPIGTGEPGIRRLSMTYSSSESSPLLTASYSSQIRSTNDVVSVLAVAFVCA